jgi:hypothetical protein
MLIVFINVSGQIKLETTYMSIYNKHTKQSIGLSDKTPIFLNNGYIYVDEIKLKVITFDQEEEYKFNCLVKDETGDVFSVELDFEDDDNVFVTINGKEYLVIYKCKITYIK